MQNDKLEDNIGLQLTQLHTHGKIINDYSLSIEYEESHSLLTYEYGKTICRFFAELLLKIILCASFFVDLIAGYFKLVVIFNLDKFQVMHIAAGLLIAMLIMSLWEILSEWME